MTKKVLNDLLTISNQTCNDKVIDHFIEHDPGNRKTIESASQRKYLVSLGPYQPKLATYPKNSDIAHGKQNQFSSLWFKEFPHLEYSVVKDAAFCFICSLFPKGPNRNFAEIAWVKNGVNAWYKFKSRGKKKSGKLAEHFSSLSHKLALIDFSNFLSNTNHIDCILNKSNRLNEINFEYQKRFNQKVITMLMDITRTLARQGLAYRGEGENEENSNFNQIVLLLSRHSPIMKKWLDEKMFIKYHMTYLSHESQNEFISLLACETKKKVIAQVVDSGMYSVMADTTPDVSHKDQLSVCVRYVDSLGEISERLLEVCEANDKTGLGIAEKINDVLKKNGLSVQNIAFQSYDFASSMSGKLNGTQRKLSDIVGHKIPFIPCQAHRLNTFLEHSCFASVIIGDLFSCLEQLYVFFSGSTKRHAYLETNLFEIENALKLVNLSKTRWTARAESIKAVWISYEQIINTLQDMTNLKSMDKKTCTLALGLSKKILSFVFVICLSFMKTIMYKTKILTENLEATELNIVDALILLKHAIDGLTKMRDDNKSMNDLIEKHLQNCMLTIEPLVNIFKVPWENNCSLDDLKKLMTIFPPGCNESKISDFDGVLAELDILHHQCKNKNISKLIEIYKVSEELKHILPTGNKICRLIFTAPVSTASNERTFTNVGDLQALVVHFKIIHLLKSDSAYTCLENACSQSFNCLSSFKRHVNKKHIISDHVFQNISTNTNNVDVQISKKIKLNYEPSLNLEEPFHDELTNNFNFENSTKVLYESTVKFILSLYNNNNFNISDVHYIQSGIKENILKPMAYLLKNVVNKDIKEPILLSTFNRLEKVILNPFIYCSTEYRLNKWLTDNKLMSNVQQININNELCAVNHGEHLEMFFQILSKENCGKKKITQFDGKIVFPYFLYIDDFEINNPLRSHATYQSIAAIYYSFPLVENNSKLSNIFLAALIKSADLKEFGNDPCLLQLINEINFLEKEGLSISTEYGEFQVYFILGLVLGDNLGLNSILEFSKSFSSNYYCRCCKIHKSITQKLCVENISNMRNSINYSDDVAQMDFSETGVNKNSILNSIKSFHVTENYCVDVMHDVFEGICHYDICHIIKYYVYTAQIFSLDTLNKRKTNFNYGSIETGNISPEISVNHLNKYHLKMSAREMMSFIHFFSIMVGDLIPDDDEVWKFFLVLLKIIDLLLSYNFTEGKIMDLKQLISQHNSMYIRLFNDTLKPKHHFLIHYPTIIQYSGPPRFYWCFNKEMPI
ncbi:zinc finger MYM-type protein 1-like [Aphis craccivora]|uniref:Zinc finger MYM-type protein 1-like n=1 Tax=Aphis craccivora TaxID=307492 RepID=A0A6G0Z258_APHCR|nr:zinc finger MYM-type protein 1-like [Aphis craccivora]